MCVLVEEVWECNSKDCDTWGIIRKYVEKCKAMEEGRTQDCVNRGRPDPDHPYDKVEKLSRDSVCWECKDKMENERGLQQ